MSENILEYNFSNDKKPKSIKAIVNKICKFHSVDNKERENISSGKRGSDYFVSMWVDDVDNMPNIDILKLLNSFPSEKAAYAKLEMDMTGDIFYFAVEEERLMKFDSEKELSKHYNIGGESVENRFFELVDKQSSHLLIRTKISLKKKLKSLLKYSSEYIENKSDDYYIALKNEINKNFPFTHNYCKKKEQCDYDFGRHLMFVQSQDNFLFFGFEFSEETKIRPCRKQNAYYNAERNIKNKEGLMILELIESLLYIDSVSSIEAKFTSQQEGFSGLFWSREGNIMEYSPFWESPNLPARVW